MMPAWWAAWLKLLLPPSLRRWVIARYFGDHRRWLDGLLYGIRANDPMTRLGGGACRGFARRILRT